MERAKIRVEHIIREDYMVEAMEVTIDYKTTLCEVSKQIWNEALQMSLDIYR